MSDEGPDFDRIIPVHTEPIYSAIKTRIVGELQSKGIYPAPPVLDGRGQVVRPVLPPQLSSLSPAATLDLLGQYGAYLEYISSVVQDYATDYDAWSRTKTCLVSELRTALTGSPQRIKDEIENDPRYRDVDEKEFTAKTRYTMASAVEKGAENSRATVSRAITSQGQELDRGGRESNVAPHRKGNYGPNPATGTVPSRFIRPR